MKGRAAMRLAVNLQSIDLKDSHLHSDSASQPVYWNPEINGPGFWDVTSTG
jgi:hypothetical protein